MDIKIIKKRISAINDNISMGNLIKVFIIIVTAALMGRASQLASWDLDNYIGSQEGVDFYYRASKSTNLHFRIFLNNDIPTTHEVYAHHKGTNYVVWRHETQMSKYSELGTVKVLYVYYDKAGQGYIIAFNRSSQTCIQYVKSTSDKGRPVSPAHEAWIGNSTYYDAVVTNAVVEKLGEGAILLKLTRNMEYEYYKKEEFWEWDGTKWKQIDMAKPLNNAF